MFIVEIHYVALRKLNQIDLSIDIQYSVMKSDGNSFCGDVVSHSFNKTSRNEDKILDHIYSYYYYNDFNSL